METALSVILFALRFSH